jgi:lipid-binding SYLF domain-containing protein
MKQVSALILGLALVALLVGVGVSAAGTRDEINAAANKTLQSFDKKYPGTGRELARKAAGWLVFPSVYKGGIGIGGSYGEGVLIVKGEPGGYYNIISASFGFQLGAQAQTIIIMFMTEEALAAFKTSTGFKVGVDGSIVVVNLGAGGSIDTDTLTSPIIAFVLDQAGLMYSLSLEGSKISEITR